MLMRQTKNYPTSKSNDLSPHVFPRFLLPHPPISLLFSSHEVEYKRFVFVFQNLMTLQVLDNNQLSALVRGSEPSLAPLGKVLGIHNSWSTVSNSATVLPRVIAQATLGATARWTRLARTTGHPAIQALFKAKSPIPLEEQVSCFRG